MWQGILGHDDVVERFRQSLRRGRLASTFLFVGPPGIGKHTFALKLAQALLCQRNPAQDLNPCGQCDSCVQAEARVHPDLLLIAKPADKSFIPVAAFVGEPERRMREGLCHDIALKPFMGGRKVAVINDADFLNEEGANALLKTLEEPPPRSVLILIGTSVEKQLPTIRSRSQVIRFRPLDKNDVHQILVQKALVDGQQDAERLARFSEGSIQRALELADADLWQFRGQLFTGLAAREIDSVALARSINEFVDAAGKEASSRRNRLRQVIRFVTDFQRQQIRGVCGLEPTGDDDLVHALKSCVAARYDIDQLTTMLSRSLEALGHVDRNAHQATLIDCWLDDLVQTR